MRILKNIIFSFFFLILLVLLQIAVAYLLPYPFSNINSIFIALIIFMLVKESGSVMWLGFFAFFILELYSPPPFGLVMAAGTMALLAAYWFYHQVFTNKSWYATLMLSAIAVSLYRIFFFLEHALLDWKTGNDVHIRSIVTPAIGWEIILTSTLTAALFYGIVVFLKQTAPIRYKSVYEHDPSQHTFRF